jgi:dienelactone hydrolase
MAHYSQAALDAGIAVVTVDSMAPRGISRMAASLLVCTGMRLKGAERAGDLFAVYDWVQQQSWADPSRIAAAGWSHGGWTIMDAIAAGPDASRYCRLSDLPEHPLEGLAAALLIYPYAGFPSLTISRGWGKHRPKVFALLGGRDQVVGVRLPARAIDRLVKDGVVVERLVFADATHAFDDDAPSDPRSAFREDLRSEATQWYAASLKSALLA